MFPARATAAARTAVLACFRKGERRYREVFHPLLFAV